MTIEDYSKKVKKLERKLDTLEAFYEKHSNSLSTDTLIAMENEKTEILKELIVITTEAFAAIGNGTENTREISLNKKKSSILEK